MSSRVLWRNVSCQAEDLSDPSALVASLCGVCYQLGFRNGGMILILMDYNIFRLVLYPIDQNSVLLQLL